MAGFFEIRVLLRIMEKSLTAVLTCIFALGGATVGTITGAIKGQTTETGLVRGAAVGAVTGAITAVQLMDMMINGEPFSKVALLCSLVNGKVFTEWVSPAVLKAYQWQISAMETSFRDILDIFEVNTTRGLSRESIERLPKYQFCPSNQTGECHDINCTICLQDFESGETGRELPGCRHRFHLGCIDEWLVRHGSCPVCRNEVY